MDFEFAAFALEHPAAERWGYHRSATRVAEQLQGSLSLSSLSLSYHWAHIKTLVLGYIEYALDWVYMPQDLSDPITSQEYDYSTQVDDQPTDTICDLAGSVSREGGWEGVHALHITYQSTYT